MFCVKGLCLLYFHHVKDEFKSYCSFCYVCGEMIFKSERWNFTPLIKKLYDLHFWFKVGDQGKSWATRICYVTCVRLPTGWVNSSRKMLFAFPMVWEELRDHASGCFFCFSNIKKDHLQIQTHSESSSLAIYIRTMRSVAHSEDLPVPKPLTFSNDNSDSDENRRQQVGKSVDFDPTSEASCFSSELRLLTER